MIQLSVLMLVWLVPVLKQFTSTGRYLLWGYVAEILWSEPALGVAYSAKQANKKPLHAQICSAEWFFFLLFYISIWASIYLHWFNLQVYIVAVAEC